MYRFLMAFLALIALNSWAAKISNVVVLPQDGDGQANAHTIKVEILSEVGDPETQLDIRAFLSKNAEVHVPMKLVQGGELLASAAVHPAKLPKDTPFALSIQTFKLPLANLSVQNGVVQFRYVASLKTGARQLDEMGSELQTIQVDGKTRTTVLKPIEVAHDSSTTQALIVGDDGKLIKSNARVTIFPSRAKDASVSLEEHAKETLARAMLRPQDLAPPRRDVPQPMAKNENIVYFATTRKVESIRGNRFKFKFLPQLRAQGLPGLSWGTCNVDLPTREQEQSWNAPTASILTTSFLTEGRFLDAISNSTSKDVLLFVHGYANSFEDVILQTARLKRDLRRKVINGVKSGFQGNVMAYSWPSHGKVTKYPSDQEMTDPPENLEVFDYVLEKVFSQVKEQGGKLIVFGHSMGNRHVTHALRSLYLKRGQELSAVKKEDRTLSNVVFAAPDVDLNTFSAMVPNAVAMADMVSFYYSSKDKALDLSEKIHTMNRAGLYPIFNDLMATINTDKLKGWFSMGHDYYTSSDRAVLDLYLQINYRRQPPSRIPPLERDVEGERRFQFKHWFLVS